MILGRNPALWLGVIAALLNVAVIVFGIPLTTEGLASINAAAVAVIALVANVSDPTALPTFARSVTRPSFSIASSGATASPSGTPTDPSAGAGAGGATAGPSGAGTGSTGGTNDPATMV